MLTIKGAPPTGLTSISARDWIFFMVGPKFVTSSGKNSVSTGSPPLSRTYFCTTALWLAVVIICCHDINFLAPFVHRVGHQFLNGLGRSGACAKIVVLIRRHREYCRAASHGVKGGPYRPRLLQVIPACTTSAPSCRCSLGGKLSIKLD